MDVKEAARVAKDWVRDVLADENPLNIGIEEVEYNRDYDEWLVTVGFSRPWNSTRNPITMLSEDENYKRTYKVIRISGKE